MNQTTLGSLVGLSQARISELERGDFKGIDIGLVEELARVLEVSPQYLAGWTDDPLYEINEEPTNRDGSSHHIDPATRELLDIIEDLDADQRRRFVDAAKLLLGVPRIIE
ncbi:MAG: helix-turn-helix transcriptional regulator [Caldilineaceae bacterium]|nr:helix-turn-helix transcriptional regulator [Caldilineaceae bacterium]